MHNLDCPIGLANRGQWCSITPPSCTCKIASTGFITGPELTAIKLQYQKQVAPTNAQVFKESVLSHINGINKIINLYDHNQNMSQAKALLDVAYDLIIKGLAANDEKA